MDHILLMYQVLMRALIPRALHWVSQSWYHSLGQERVTTGTEGLELHFGLLNASATHFDTSGHAAPSFLQVL